MNFDHGIHSLEKLGFNIFLSAKVSDLPENIFPFTDDQKKKTLCLVGHGGKTLWENIPDIDRENPIDQFSIDQMKWFAENVLDNDIEILFPHDEMILPLQKIGRFLNLSSQSPLGIDISNEFGLWFAFRGIFLTNQAIPLLKKSPTSFPCDSCSEKPCLSEEEIFKARLKCPVKKEHRYTLEQRNYHQSVISHLKKLQ